MLKRTAHSTDLIVVLNKCDILDTNSKAGVEFAKFVTTYKDKNDFEHVSSMYGLCLFDVAIWKCWLHGYIRDLRSKSPHSQAASSHAQETIVLASASLWETLSWPRLTVFIWPWYKTRIIRATSSFSARVSPASYLAPSANSISSRRCDLGQCLALSQRALSFSTLYIF